MKQIKKSLSIFMAAIFVMAGILGNVTANAAQAVTTKATQVLVPAINYVGVEHSPLIVGDTEKFTVTSSFSGKVQYRAFMFDGKTWAELTKGYGASVDAKTPYVLPETPAFKLGKAKVSVWVKRDGETGIQSNKNGNFDSYYVAELNCVAKNDASRVYANGKADYTVNGMKLTFNKIEGINGIPGPYKYAMHVMDPTTGVWTKRVTTYQESPSYTFTKPGTYMVVVHANTEKSTTWAKYLAQDKTDANQGSTYGTYEAWKTIMVTVKAEDTVKVFDTTVKAATFGAAVNVTMTTGGTKNFPTATKYQVIDGTSAISAIVNLGTVTTAMSIPAKVAGDKVNIKLLDANAKEVKVIEVALGQSGTITVAPVVPVDPTTSEIKATVKAGTFGALVTVTSTSKDAVKYQVFNGTSALSAIEVLGTATTVMSIPAKVAGDKVNVKLINAAGTVIATNEVALVAAK
ncbi:hypothetical protein [Clostridium tagluense]|uniref:PKD domain-containing protein n=1 Tax=Clostridium tagluense TaxID=360422 RepID=A0A401UJM6_9CLOT|nr:hypothetical protein [Clostridium tagluense]GCD09754.1 hypothetical protein Ctaglu_13770 [Clostridium tagluense]